MALAASVVAASVAWVLSRHGEDLTKTLLVNGSRPLEEGAESFPVIRFPRRDVVNVPAEDRFAGGYVLVGDSVVFAFLVQRAPARKASSSPSVGSGRFSSLPVAPVAILSEQIELSWAETKRQTPGALGPSARADH